jgi:uncharacterized coiled-coil DUF342 family protein
MTNQALQLEVDHCHAVCAELRQQLTKAKSERDAFSAEVDAANDKAGELAEQLAELTQAKAQRDIYRKALAHIAAANEQASAISLRDYAAGFVGAEI